MFYLIDILAFIVPIMITAAVYLLYYQISIKGYVRKIEAAHDKGEYDKVFDMISNARLKQPKKMARLLREFDQKKIERVKRNYSE